MLDFRIDTFLCVCKEMNFTHAADKLNITQPAVSQHIKYLEKEYKTKLFIQDGKKLYLTDSGKLLYRKMNQIKNDEGKLKIFLKDSDHENSKLTFGVTMTIGEYAISAPISKYLKLYPESNIEIHFGNTKELLNDLHEGIIDFALVEGYFPEKNYETMVFKSEEFIPVCAYNHEFKKKPHRLKDLFDERLLVREQGSGTRNILERVLAVQNYDITNFPHYIQVENMHMINQLLILDCGISFLYKAAVEKELDDKLIRQIPLKDFDIKHDFTFIWPQDSIFSKSIEKSCKEIMQCL